MSNDVIFFTQITTIVIFIMALFGIYRSLVSQKDGVIELLREQLKQQENKINDLQAQSPDVLTKTLSERIEIAINEIERLKLDDYKRKERISAVMEEYQRELEKEIKIIEEKKSALEEKMAKKHHHTKVKKP